MNLALSTKRRLVLLAACALIACAAVYSTHAAERSHGQSHCDLCLHFSGTAGSPAQATVVGKALLVVGIVPLPPPTIRPTRSPLGIYLPRGPPLHPSHV